MEVDPECGDEQPSSDDCKGVQSSFALFPFFFFAICWPCLSFYSCFVKDSCKWTVQPNLLKVSIQKVL